MSSKIKLRGYKRYRLAQLVDVAVEKCVRKAEIKKIEMARQFYLKCERFRSELGRV